LRGTVSVPGLIFASGRLFIVTKGNFQYRTAVEGRNMVAVTSENVIRKKKREFLLLITGGKYPSRMVTCLAPVEKV
jgi:hypothetical protein